MHLKGGSMKILFEVKAFVGNKYKKKKTTAFLVIAGIAPYDHLSYKE